MDDDPQRLALDHAYYVVGEMLEYFERYHLATWAPLAAIIMRERKAAYEEAAQVAEKWRDENRTACNAARKRERRLNALGFDHPGMADMLDGAAIECNAIAQAIRELPAQGIAARSDETLQATQPEGQEPGGEAMRQNPNSTPSQGGIA